MAFEYAQVHRPQIGGFPFLAECLRRAGVEKNIWYLPSTHHTYLFHDEALVDQGVSLISGMSSIPAFHQDALISALRADQDGKSSFPEFLMAAWKAGTVRYDVDFLERTVTYYGARGEQYQESYPAVEVLGLSF